jgi:hypothetical protein
MFHIAKPFQLLHCPGPFPSVAKSAVMRLTCTLALVCLIASCAPPVATVVEDQSGATKPVIVKNTTPEPDPVIVPSPGRRALMQAPDMTRTLPEGRDFQATAPPQTTADRGPNLMVPAPKPQPTE